MVMMPKTMSTEQPALRRLIPLLSTTAKRILQLLIAIAGNLVPTSYDHCPLSNPIWTLWIGLLYERYCSILDFNIFIR